jgi:hypothetical protein
VAKREEVAATRAATEANDVAAILRRRMEHCLGAASDSSSPSSMSPTGRDSADWED